MGLYSVRLSDIGVANVTRSRKVIDDILLQEKGIGGERRGGKRRGSWKRRGCGREAR